ncbi:hypothetical protein LTR37_011749 [Vermiconidia calcicola]|uniref:Uncharacterized protein n=1 Tax=Vermiconidia calcicola TaxID=1690605 RepID=A0ACC3N1K9_9PEZI|nr:hypothetical protein LTR37_011749 [Vermiconidia calcicola]
MCPLCGIRNDRASVQLEPPTAGIRILSLDGGGVRGIIPLVFLRRIEERLQELEMPLSENFDLVCGTSAGETSSVTGLSLPYEKLTLDTGGLITIGLFLMQWNVDECLTKFETLAEKTFRRRNGYTVFGRIQELAMSYFRDGQYSSLAIEESFQSVFGDDMKMFNPLCNNTKVAVTTTTAKDARPCLFSNYNGGIRPPSIGYDIIRASRPEDDVCLREAASCTSAAPWFFRPKIISEIGTFEDGGLQHNNPLNIALWEASHIWPRKGLPDFALSIELHAKS